MGVLLEVLDAAWRAVGLDALKGADEVFRQLVVARLIEPTSKRDSLRVHSEASITPVSYVILKRHLPRYATEEFTQGLSRVLAHHARIERPHWSCSTSRPCTSKPTAPTASASRAFPRSGG